MTKEFWISLPVKNINMSKAFFAKLGFPFNDKFGGNPENSACMLLGEKKVVVMLVEESVFKGFTGNEVADAGKVTEVLFSIDAESKEEVDAMANKAIEAGGKSNHTPGVMKGWMYGCVFTDLDGHSWNVLHMDMSKM